MKWKASFVLLEILYAGFASIGVSYVFGRSFGLDCFTKYVLALTVFVLYVFGTMVLQEFPLAHARLKGVRAPFDNFVGPDHRIGIDDTEWQNGCSIGLTDRVPISKMSYAVAGGPQS